MTDDELQKLQDRKRAEMRAEMRAEPKSTNPKPMADKVSAVAASIMNVAEINRRNNLNNYELTAADIEEEKKKTHRIAADNGMIDAEVPTLYRKWGLHIDFGDVLPDGADWSKRGYCLRGPTGNRKSSLAGALVRDRLRQMEKPSGTRMRWVSVRLFVQRIKSATQSNSRETPYDILGAIANLDLLIVDDLGKEQDHEWDRSILGTMIWTAWDWGADLIITTQRNLSELDSIDTALASRLATLADVELGKRDWRQR